MSTMNINTACLSALQGIPGIRWNDLSAVTWSKDDLSEAEFYIGQGVAPVYARRAAAAVNEFNQDKTDAELRKIDARLITVADDEYPNLLRHIYDPPWALYLRGSLPENRLYVGMVGSRKATAYGRQVVEALVPVLAASETVVVSGLARGVDTLAHVVTLRNAGTTVAVLGTGVNNIYPRENTKLAERILQDGGGIISEYRPGAPPLALHFPARNRIISGLCRSVIIVEGDRKSGSLITAEHAMEQGRDVFAVPGSIFSPLSHGPNWLIAQGAIPVTCPEDLIYALGLSQTEVQITQASEISFELFGLLDIMGHEPRDVDYLVQQSAHPVGELLAMLAELEMSRMIERLPGGLYLALHPHLKRQL